MARIIETVPLTETMVQIVREAVHRHNLNGMRLAKRSGLSKTFIGNILQKRVYWVSAVHYRKLMDYISALDKKEVDKAKNVESVKVKTDFSDNSDPTMRFVRDFYEFLENVKVFAEDWRLFLLKEYPELIKNEIC